MVRVHAPPTQVALVGQALLAPVVRSALEAFAVRCTPRVRSPAAPLLADLVHAPASVRAQASVLRVRALVARARAVLADW